MKRLFALAVAMLAAPALAQQPADAPAVDYANDASWLCLPGRQDACGRPLPTTPLNPNGYGAPGEAGPAADPPIDCFYVYPTVSRDAGANADTNVGPEEMEVVRQQIARFGSVCRIYAPVYRQVTLAALRKMLAGEDPGSNRELAYADVRAAWQRYIDHDNQGRGVVLIGHDQGAGILTRLIAAEIDGKEAAEWLVAAILPGTGVEVSSTGSVGGSFAKIPQCRDASSTACVIAWSSFRANQPPPPDSLFGKLS